MIQDWSTALSLWTWDPSILLGTGLFLGAYLVATARRTTSRAQIAWFATGTLTILFALVSPLDRLGDEYLFSAHMIQHMLLAIAAPPLLLLGTPAWLAETLIRRPQIRWLARALTRPVAGFLLFNFIFLGWHLQGLYEATLNNEAIHIFEHLLFMITGVLNWWAILSPTPKLPVLSYPGQILYLFLEMIPLTVLGAIISFAPTILYPTYAAAPRILNLNPMDDQQIAGLAMAFPTGMIYMTALSITFFKWLDSENRPAGKKLDQRDLRN
jgi:putative membrane protein